MVNKFLFQSSDGEVKSVVLEEYVNIVPTLSTNSQDGYEVSSKSTNSANLHNSFSAFDGSLTTLPYISDGATSGEWLMIRFPRKKIVKRYDLSCANTGQTNRGMPISWKLQGSNDNNIWIDLDAHSNENVWIKGETRSYTINNSNEYLYYRIYFIANDTWESYFQIGEWKLFEGIYTVKVIDSVNKNSFIEHGMPTIFDVGLVVKTTKRQYINSQSIPLGSGKVFEQTIDFDRYKVKKITIDS